MLTRDKILATDDIAVKVLTVPSTIPFWGGETLNIRQLTRGQQDVFLKRQFGDTRMRQDRKATNQEFTNVNIYGHDAWLCVKGICDEKGLPLFTEKDIPALENKGGEFIGWVAKAILEFSNMQQDVDVLQTANERLGDDAKN
jgi:hypothetical protein